MSSSSLAALLTRLSRRPVVRLCRTKHHRAIDIERLQRPDDRSVSIPDAKKSTTPPGFAYFQTWPEVMSAWSPAFRDRTEIDYWPQTGKEFYWDVARGAAGMAATLPKGALAWRKLGELIARRTAQTGQAPNWNLDPTWAFVPRVK